MQAPWRIAVDAGGTFTDVVVGDATGAIAASKSPTAPNDPAEGILAAVNLAAQRAGLSLGDLLHGCEQFIHGSTIATNTLLEGKGAKVGLLCTLGFRDVLEIRRGLRDNPWDHRRPYPQVLVPRSRRLAVAGRLASDGSVLEPLDLAGARAAVLSLRARGAETIAIALMNSFANPSHEDELAQIALEYWPGVWVTRSADIAPLIGEYERTSTAVVDAAVAPRIVPYLRNLSAQLTANGYRRRLLLMQSNGGMLTVDQACRRPAALALSGPAAGVGALEFFAACHGASRNMISMEIGGTSCDVLIMRDGEIAMASQVEVADYHVLTPSVDIHTVSAGGGTIAKVDSGGLLVTGPEGAGSRPGPACYGRGGELPTVTDAQLALGRLKPGPYAGGVVSLDEKPAYGAIKKHIAGKLNMPVQEAAAGIVEVMEQHLLHAVEKISIERGHDPSQFVLVAVGGAGPLHGAAVGRRLGCSEVYVPRMAGVFCAIGMLNSDVRHDFAQTSMTRLGPGSLRLLASTFESLEASGRTALTEEGFAPDKQMFKRELDLRHPGQQWPVTIQLPGGADDAAARAIFADDYEKLYGHRQPDSIVEIVSVRVVAVGLAPRLPVSIAPETNAPAPDASTRDVVLRRGDAPVSLSVFEGRKLLPGHVVHGPAVVEEATTTILIGSRDQLRVDRSNNFVISFLNRN
jgi:N-methylhydantoinase A